MREPRDIAAGALMLEHGADRCVLYPQVGGSIGGWTVEGQEMLRTAGAAGVAARDPFSMASFPLVPYSNRIAFGRFEWRGRTHELAQNFPPEPHAIHGVGFERPWLCAAAGVNSALLTLTHRPDSSWPWAFEARQQITLTGRGLQLDLSAVNLEPHDAPLAFGHHPYFPQKGAELEFRAREVWLVGEDGLPSETAAATGRFDFSRSQGVEGGDIDHCFTGWGGAARIAWQEKPLALEVLGSANLTCAVVYIRPGAEGFCFEPVPHINNALNLAGREPAMPVAAPGETIRSSIRLRALAR